ncbi:MAG TPA: hypothetical protein VIE65_12830 [Methylobacter sp.]|jgi:hypothetical protein
MTGTEFKAAIKGIGYTQTSFAKLMGVHRETIGTQCQLNEIDAHWGYALLGVIAKHRAEDLLATVAKIIDIGESR